jgi:hypothetical protein
MRLRVRFRGIRCPFVSFIWVNLPAAGVRVDVWAGGMGARRGRGWDACGSIRSAPPALGNRRVL